MHDLSFDIVNPGARRAIAFFHGFLGDKSEFRAIGRLFERTHTVLYFDLPGHGLSAIDVDAPCDFESISRSIAEVLKIHAKCWHLVGYSLGGRMALHLACRQPELVNRLTLVSASPGLESATERLARIRADIQLARALQRNTLTTFLKFWYRQPLFKTMRAHPRFLEMLQSRMRGDEKKARHKLEHCSIDLIQEDIRSAWREDRISRDETSFFPIDALRNPSLSESNLLDSAPSIQLSSALNALSVGRQPSLWSHLPKLQMPVAFICGAEDDKFVQIGQKMKLQNPRIQLEVVAQAGHVVHWEAPKRVKEVIQNVDNFMENRAHI